MNTARATLLTAILLLYHAGCGPVFALADWRPHLLLGAVCCIALHGSRKQALLTAAIAGVALDVFSLDPPGSNLGAFLLAAWVLRRARRAGWTDHAAPRALLLFTALLGALVVHGGGVWLADGATAAAASYLVCELPLKVGLYSFVMSWPLFLLIGDSGALFVEPTPYRAT